MAVAAAQEPVPALPIDAVADPITAEPFPSMPPSLVIRAILWLRRQLMGAANALVPAEVRIWEMTFGAGVTEAIGVIARRGIADKLANGPLSAVELAAQTGLQSDALHRLMRGMATIGVFTLDGEGRFANNRYSEALRAGRLSHLRDYCLYFSSRSNLQAWHDIEETLKSGKNAFERVHGMSVWEWFDRHPDERETFARAMMGMTTADAPMIARLYPWREVKRVCDVGGGRGTLLSELLIRHPHLTGVLCDGAGVIESARRLLDKRGVSARVQLVPGSFFDAVPIGADAYVLKNILHDWDDARSLHILGVVRKAMQKRQRLILCETLTERNDVAGLGALADLQMMAVCGDGRERSRDEYAELLAKSGFRVGRVLPSPTVSVIEAIAE
jgi:hypothetical protein